MKLVVAGSPWLQLGRRPSVNFHRFTFAVPGAWDCPSSTERSYRAAPRGELRRSAARSTYRPYAPTDLTHRQTLRTGQEYPAPVKRASRAQEHRYKHAQVEDGKCTKLVKYMGDAKDEGRQELGAARGVCGQNEGPAYGWFVDRDSAAATWAGSAQR